jgi:signal peptidase I
MKKAIFEFAKTMIIAIAIAMLITTFFKPTLVKGYSMYPTIEPNNYLIINKIPYMQGTPGYGDIIVFKAHIAYEGGEEKDLIKRVIGLPGDTIRVSDGIVYRNGEALDEPYVYGGSTPGDMETITVSEDHLFVMGDNRPVSLDSRDPSLGEIAINTVLGQAALRLYPFDEIGAIQ